MNLQLATTCIMALAILFAPAETTRALDNADTDDPKVVAITMHADWCGTCQSLNPKVEEVQAQLKDSAVLFTRFDVTDEYTTRQSAMKANWLGLGSIFEENKDSTGYVLLIDPATKEVIGRITNENNEREIRQAIARHL